MPDNKVDVSSPQESPRSTTRPLPLKKRLLRAAPSFCLLVLIVALFSRLGILHKLETTVSDVEMRANRPPEKSDVAIVSVDDEDYKEIFGGTSPLKPEPLRKLVTQIASGKPAVIGVDIDTSSAQFKHFQVSNWGSKIVWEREVKEAGAAPSEYEKVEPMDVLGGKQNLDPSRNSFGLALLIEDPEDKVTRRYRRLIPTKFGSLPSFPWAIVKACLTTCVRDKAEESSCVCAERLSKLKEDSSDLLIRYSGDPSGSHRLKLTARRVLELSSTWSQADPGPFKDKIVLLGGSYLDQDRHETPIGRLTGLEIMANVVETDLAGKGRRPPGGILLFTLSFFEGFVLILIFHLMRIRWALFFGGLLVLVVGVSCRLASGDWFYALHFAPILLGLILFEGYEHFRRAKIPSLFDMLFGKPKES